MLVTYFLQIMKTIKLSYSVTVQLSRFKVSHYDYATNEVSRILIAMIIVHSMSTGQHNRKCSNIYLGPTTKSYGKTTVAP